MARFLVIWYFITINVVGLLMMRNDKRNAQQRKRRTPERNLWLVAWIGGAPGMTVGMRMHRHKTKHVAFKYGFPVLAIIDVVIYVYLIGRVS